MVKFKVFLPPVGDSIN